MKTSDQVDGDPLHSYLNVLHMLRTMSLTFNANF